MPAPECGFEYGAIAGAWHCLPCKKLRPLVTKQGTGPCLHPECPGGFHRQQAQNRLLHHRLNCNRMNLPLSETHTYACSNPSFDRSWSSNKNLSEAPIHILNTFSSLPHFHHNADIALISLYSFYKYFMKKFSTRPPYTILLFCSQKN